MSVLERKKMNTIRIILTTSFLFFGAQAHAAEFSFTFSWEGLKLCSSGYPNSVFNPPFKLKNVPAGTTWIQFRLTDKDAPNYNHGGGWVQFSGNNNIEMNQFKYESPCPPSGSHTYEWTATAKTKKSGGQTLARAKSKMKYP